MIFQADRLKTEPIIWNFGKYVLWTAAILLASEIFWCSVLKFNLPDSDPAFLFLSVVKSQIELAMVINYFTSETKTCASCKSLYL